MYVTIIATDTLLYQKKIIRIARRTLKATNRRILVDARCTTSTTNTKSAFNNEIKEKCFVKHFLTINYLTLDGHANDNENVFCLDIILIV
jgi:hypothetical protein